VKATYRERVAALEQAARGEPAQVAWGAASSEAARPSS
jgi:hypothetical protein